MSFIIDGHNLLWTIAGRAEEHGSVTDLQLCHILSRFMRVCGEKGELVFDGAGPRDRGPYENMPSLDVTFAGAASDCDTVIEHRIESSSAPRDLVIVSSDRRLRVAAAARKAAAVKCDVFWKQVQKKLAEQKKVREPPGKRHGITEQETELWMRLFGLDQ
jgi:predicted RNA-binding protein with PIN domain